MLNIIRSIIQIIKSLIAFFLLVCLVFFMVNNRDLITINAYPLPITIETRVFFAMLFFFVLGMMFGFLAFSTNMFGKSFRNFKDRLTIRKLQKEKKVEAQKREKEAAKKD